MYRKNNSNNKVRNLLESMMMIMMMTMFLYCECWRKECGCAGRLAEKMPNQNQYKLLHTYVCMYVFIRHFDLS